MSGELPVPDESLWYLGRYAAAFAAGLDNDEHKAVRDVAAPAVAAYLRGLADNLGDLRLGPEDLRLLAEQADGGAS